MDTVWEVVIHFPIVMLGDVNMKAISLCNWGLRFTEVTQADARDYGCEVSGNGEIHWLRRSKWVACISQQTELPPHLTCSKTVKT